LRTGHPAVRMTAVRLPAFRFPYFFVTSNRHPEAAAQRPSKETAEALRPPPFEARSARTSG
jgi:hypothetical protein